ncbi:MAG TPA: DNA polymerase/3'-5' exonuclease PolX [Verrucomicrobiales bacterium]|nr:DNA polymerase/3'-5' exonuclease PolX [Verrucomicrobiales bacterium]
MTREDLADVLDRIALLLELQGENPFKIRAYKTGAEIVRSHPDDILRLARENQLDGIKGLGEALQKKLHELASTGHLVFYDELRKSFPETLFELFDLPGLGPKKVKALHDQLAITSVADVKAACEDGRIANLAGFGQKTAENLLAAIAWREQNAGSFRIGDAAPIAEQLLARLREHPDASRVEAAGSYRRGKEIIHDLDFLVATSRPAGIMDLFVGMPEVAEVLANGATKSSVRLRNGLQCDLRAVTNEEFACALAYFTGSKEHNVALRSRALARGWTLNEYRLSPKEGSDTAPPPIFPDEAALHRWLGLDFVPPELRENQGEIVAAAEGRLPRLIELENLRGTFHNHTTASDGRNSLEEMAEAALELGLQYLGIADHSKSSFQANGLNETRLRRQIEEIRNLNARWRAEEVDFRLLAGSEVDILKDGNLDFDDGLLSELDYVVASVHSVFTLSEAEMTERIIRAISNPHVTMLGHLTGRLLLEREAYAVDVPAVIEACAETGTIIELNCNPWRLDMDWRWWKLAKEKGVKCAINPDAHRTEDLQWLWLGVKLARKGWLTRADVINCLTPDELPFLRH